MDRLPISRFMLLLLLSSFFAVNLSMSQNATQCLAVITELDGKVLVKKSDKNNFDNVSWGTQLYEGDQLKTSEESSVSLLFSNGNLISLGSGSKITITNNKIAASDTETNVKNVQSAMMANFSILTSRRDERGEVGALAGVRSINTVREVELISPCNTVIKTSRPAFSWSSIDSFDSYKVKLYSSRGLVWDKTVSGNRMEYPEDSEELEYGESYFWYVEGEDLITSYKSANQEFSLLSLEKSNEVKLQEENIRNLFSDDPNSSTCHSVLGVFYTNKGLLEDGIKEFILISEINPGASLPHEILGKLYTDAGKKDMAIAELKKALSLSKIEK